MQRILTQAGWLLAFVSAYVALDRLSYLHALHGLNITPWNPALALALVCTLKFGRALFAPWLLAMLIGQLTIRALPVPWWRIILLESCLLAGYAIIVAQLERRTTARDLLNGRRPLLALLAITGVSTLLGSALYVAAVVSLALIPPDDWRVALFRLWIGDFVGVTSTLPFFWLVIAAPHRLRPVLRSADTPGYVILALALTATTFWLGTQQINVFCLLLLPLVWAATRHGVVGTAVTAFILQAGIVIGAHWMDISTASIFELQILSAALVVCGLFLGVAMDEKTRLSTELAQSLHLAAAGEMAAALTHELNQPLSALTTYASTCQHLVDRGEGSATLRTVVEHMQTECTRAADVVHNLRNFFRHGSTHCERIAVAELLSDSTARFADKARHRHVALDVSSPAGNVYVYADRVQLAVVLRNLLANAFDAIGSAPQPGAAVTVAARISRQGDWLYVRVDDTGPGVSEDQAQRIFDIFHTSKASGMGVGLAISRAIAEAHGGSLCVATGAHGSFRLALPIQPRGHSTGRTN